MKKRFFKRILSAALSAALMFSTVTMTFPQVAVAEGSASMNTTTGKNRVFTEFKTGGSSNTTANIQRNTVVYCYAFENEVITLASSYNAGTNDIVLTAPDGKVTNYDNTTSLGYISDYSHEKAGPNYDGTNSSGYVPHEYKVTQTGIYTIQFTVASPNDKGNPNPIKIGDTTNDIASKGGNCTLAYWDVTVLKDVVWSGSDITSATKVTGRTYSKYVALNVGGNGNSINPTFYVVTTDGYEYKTTFKAFDPYGFIFFANSRGLVTKGENGVSAYKSVACFDNNLNQLESWNGLTFQNPMEEDTALDKTFKIFYEKPDPNLENVLFPTAYSPKPATDLSFVGSEGNSSTAYGAGGYFKFKVTNATSATLTIDLRNVKYIDKNNVSQTADLGVVNINNAVVTGWNKFYWDGRDGNGNLLPVGTYDQNSIEFSIATKSGEYHFPLFDAEANAGGISVTRVNSIYDENGNDVSGSYSSDADKVFYDNSLIGDTTNNQTQTDGSKTYLYNSQIIGGVTVQSYVDNGISTLSSISALSGVSSSDGAMKYNKRGTTYADLPSGRSYAGDQTALDIWTYSETKDKKQVFPDTPIIVFDRDSTTTIIKGMVFRDSKNFGTYSIGDGDTVLSDVKVELYNASGTKIGTTQTDAFGNYEFDQIPFDKTTAADYYVRVYNPNASYTSTTTHNLVNTNTQTNVTQTDGNYVIQTVTVGGISDSSAITAEAVGFKYATSTKSLSLKKSWPANETYDTDRPNSVTVSIKGTYDDNGTTKDTSYKYDISLSKYNSWSYSTAILPNEYTDSGGTSHTGIAYSAVSEIYTVGTTTYYYDYSDGKTYTYENETKSANSVRAPYTTSVISTEDTATNYITVVNKPTGYIELTKVDADNQSTFLDGAEFYLFSGDKAEAKTDKADAVKTGITDSNGKLGFNHLENGTYYLYEAATPSGYNYVQESLVDVKYYGNYVVTDGEVMFTPTVTNTKQVGKNSISLTKNIDSNFSVGSEFNFDVTTSAVADFSSPDTSTQSVTVSAGKLSNKITFAVTNNDYVKIKEQAVSGFKIDKTNCYITKDGVKVSTTYDDTDGLVFQALQGYSYALVFKNQKTTAEDMTFKKLWFDSSGVALAEANVPDTTLNFTLQRAISDFTTEASWSNVPTSEYDTITMNKASSWEYKFVGSSGNAKQLAKYDNLGNTYKYRLVETALSGYTTTYKNSTFEQSGVTYTAGTMSASQYGYFILNTLNTQPTVNFEFYKADAFDKTKMLSGAEFKLYKYTGAGDGSAGYTDANASDWAIVPYDTSQDEYISESSGLVSLSGLTVGSTYVLIETKAPTGYQRPSGQWLLKHDGTNMDITAVGTVPAFANESGTYYLYNYENTVLPVTGNFGVVPNILAGTGMIAVSVIIVYQKRRKEL